MLIALSLIKGGGEKIVSVLSKELGKYYEAYMVIYYNLNLFEEGDY